MPTTVYAFGGGSAAIPGYGDRWQISFGGTWALWEKWGVQFSSTAGNYDIGSINFFDPISYQLSFCYTHKNRVYLAMGGQFNFSDNNDPTGWEQQNPGAGEVGYLSYFGSADSVYAFSQLQGRLAVFARQSIQMWVTDADPGNFANVQELDNIGTKAPKSVQNIGDFDVVFLDETGFRSLRATQQTLNATIDDLGVPVDTLVQVDLATVDASTCCAIVEPTTRHYWGYLNGKIYVLARYPMSKVQAWTTYIPTYFDSGTLKTFVPQKFAVLNGRVYTRTNGRELLVYGGTDGRTYDKTVATVQLPWLDFGNPYQTKHFSAIDVAISGKWKVYCSADPASGVQEQVLVAGSTTNPDGTKDSSFDMGKIPFMANGTHATIVLTSDDQMATAAMIGSVSFLFKEGAIR